MAVDLQDKNETENDGVYDKDGEWKPPTPSASELEDQAAESSNSKAGSSADHPSRLDSGALKTAEEGGGSATSSEHKEPDNEFGYHEEGGGKKKRKKNRTAITFLAAGGSFMLAAVLIFGLLMLLFGPLKVINVAEHMTAYNLTRTTRTILQTSADDYESSIAVQGMDNATADKLTSRFGKLRAATWGKLDQFRPNKVLENLKSDGQYQYVFEDGPPRKLFPGNQQVFKGIQIGDSFVAAPEQKFLSFSENSAERLRFQTQLTDALEGGNRTTYGFVRNKIVRSELDKLGVRLRFWDKVFGKKVADATEEGAAKATAAKVFEEIHVKDSSACLSEAVCTAANETDDAVKKAVNEATDPDSAAKSADDISDNVAAATAESVESSTRSSVAKIGLQYASIVYGVGVPVCLIYEGSVVNAGDHIDNNNKAAQKTFFTLRSAADQQKAGGESLSAQGVGALDKKLGDISSSNPERRARGEVVDTVSETPEIAQPQAGPTGEYTVFDTFLPRQVSENINAITSTACPVITNPLTGAALVAAEVALRIALAGGTGGGSEAVEESTRTGVAQFVASQTDKLSRWVTLQGGTAAAAQVAGKKAGLAVFKVALQTGGILAGSYLLKLQVLQRVHTAQSGLTTQADYVNQADMGANLYANEQNRTLLYGRPMNNTEVAMSRLADNDYLKRQTSEQSLSERYFAVSNTNSLISRLGMSIANKYSGSSSGISGIAGSLASSVLNFRAVIANLASTFKPFSSRVSAAQTQGGDYNILQSGWTEDEFQEISTNPDMKAAINAEILEQSGKKGEIESKYGECFTKSMGTLLSEQKIVRNSDGSVKENEGLCSPHNLSMSNSEFGDKMVFRWRLANRNDNVLDHWLAVQNPTEDTGGQSGSSTAGATIEGNPYESSVDVACAAGTTDVGVQDAYVGGNLIKMRLCALPNLSDPNSEIPAANKLAAVNSRVSGAWLKLVNDAKAVGITLAANSSFRTMAAQEAAWERSDKTGNSVARPGHSSHQAGVAIDFAGMGGSAASGRTCSTRQTWNSPAWNWLRDNAGRYGFKQYANEAWHWDALPDSNRC